jgi:hypothetical protein
MKPNKVGQDFKHIGEKHPITTGTQKYPLWIPIVFWIAVSAVIAVSILGFMQFDGGV